VLSSIFGIRGGFAGRFHPLRGRKAEEIDSWLHVIGERIQDSQENG